jgi:uncharacterized protein
MSNSGDLMRRTIVAISAILLLASQAARAADNAGAPMTSPATPAPVVFFDIAGPADTKLTAFYAGVFGWNIDAAGVIHNAGLNGALRQDPSNKIIYLGVSDVAAALSQVVAAGGKIVQPRFAVPGVVVLGLFTDPAGNAMGLVEMKNGKPVVP